MAHRCPHCGYNLDYEEEEEPDDDCHFEGDEECEECGGLNGNHKAFCSESGSSYYQLITEGYD